MSVLPVVVASGVCSGIATLMGSNDDVHALDLEKVLKSMPFRPRRDDAQG